MNISILLTAQPRSMNAALSELRVMDSGIKSVGRLSDSIAIVECGMPFEKLASACMRTPPVFAQHMCPNDIILPADATPDDICVAVSPLLEEAAQPVAVQARFTTPDEGAGVKRALADALASMIAGMGLKMDTRNPVTVVSVCAAQSGVYIGVSKARDNLCPRGGRAHGFGRLEEKISRSELKLLEALETFNITLPDHGRAIDLGAAPGGWTHALAELRLSVDAVDPAALHASLTNDTNINHHRMTAQAYLTFAEDGTFDALVNDMRMDARDSCAIMLAYRKKLKPGGIAIMTVKLPGDGARGVVSAALRTLSAAYTVIGARQLYHNRSEVTATLRN